MSRAEFLEDTRLEARDALALIVAMRDQEPEYPIPTRLMVAIEAARKVIGAEKPDLGPHNLRPYGGRK